MGTEQLLLIGGLAILDTLSPTTIGVTIYLLLTDKENLTKRLFVYLLTVAGCYFCCWRFTHVRIRFLFKFISGLFQNRIVSWLLFIIGVILFIVSFYIPPKKNSEVPSPKQKYFFNDCTRIHYYIN